MPNSNSNNAVCRIIVDAMGGDFAPLNVLLGAAEAASGNPSLNLFLTGPKDLLSKIITEKNILLNTDCIIDSSQVIGMDEHPASAIKSKPDSSIVVGVKKVKSGEADAFVSAGNTGAVMAASTLFMGRIKGVSRPTIGALMPNLAGVCMLYDVGSNVDAKPKNLFEWAVMASIFVSEIYGINNPTVGLLSVGEEKEKGNAIVLEAHELLHNSNLNFIGNVEGRDILKGSANIIVCDGFTGNIVLKFGESVLSFLKTKFKDFAQKSFTNKLKIGLVKGAMKEILSDFDSEAQGGVPLLGVNGISIIGHGSSSPLAIKNMILRAQEMHSKNLVQKIAASVNSHLLNKNLES
ncbi:MAG: phosphate acyltransferase PlsX [Bacteroidota bacterium]|nr:phosphate acyltransferase PlsX [Bacteroidota bacterium]